MAKRILGQERETIIRWNATGEPAVIGSNIPGDIRKLTKLWGPSQDIRGDWHSWPIPKRQAKLPRPPRQRAPRTEAQKATGRKLAESRKAVRKAHNRSKSTEK